MEWTPEEESKLKELYLESSKEDILAKLPNKDWGQIKRKAFKLKINRKRNLDKENSWSNEDVALLQEIYPTKNQEEIESSFPSRTWQQIADKAHKLKIKRLTRTPNNPDSWTNEDEKWLAENYSLPKEKICERFPKREWKYIQHKLYRMGIKRGNVETNSWSEKDLDYLKENYKEKSAQDIAKEVGRSDSAVMSMANSLGVIKNEKGIPWSEEEIGILREMYPRSPKEDILNNLPGRTWSGIERITHLNKIKRDKEIIFQSISENNPLRIWSDNDIAYIKDNYFSAPKETILENLKGKDWEQITRYCAKKGFNRDLSLASKERITSWTREEEEYIRDNYWNTPISEILEYFPDKSWDTIKAFCARNNIKRSPEIIKKDTLSNNPRIWSESELNTLKELYPNSPKEKLLESIPNRNYKSIRAKAFEVGIIRDENIIKEESRATQIKGNQEKYGVDHPMSLPEFQDKVKKANIDAHGGKHHSQTPEFLEKIKKTNMEKFGVEFASQNKEIIKKVFETKKLNGTINSSEPEDMVKELIETIHPDMIHQYNSDIYPFSCDYFIPSQNLYIEYQGFWTHGEEPYNGKNLDPSWEEKAKESDFYKSAIATYTKSDPNKRKKAQDNNLNYLEIWDSDYSKGLDWIKSLLLKQNLPLKYSESTLLSEFNKIIESKGTYEINAIHNKIVEHFQYHFYLKERELWNNPKKRDQIIDNRKKYIGKSIDQLTCKEILQGFKISGMNRNAFSFFSPLWIKAFIAEYDIKSIYDPCAGWGHRMLGAHNIEYHGNDACSKTALGLNQIKNHFNLNNHFIYSNQAEDFVLDKKVDAVFTCPPYFDIEIYEGDNTSTSKFPKYSLWLNDWWRMVVKNCLKSKPRLFSFVINKKYKDDLIKICTQENLIFLKEINLGSNNYNHFQKANQSVDKGEFLVIFENILN